MTAGDRFNTDAEMTWWTVTRVGQSERYFYVSSTDMSREQAEALAAELKAFNLSPSNLAAALANARALAAS